MQSDDVQKDILGNRYNFYNEGRSIERQFLNNGKMMTIRELEKKTVRNMANGSRRGLFEDITDAEKQFVKDECKRLGIDLKIVKFENNVKTAYIDSTDIVRIGSDVFPSNDDSVNPIDRMPVACVLAHEYYGHRHFRNTKLIPNSPIDEFRASYYSSVHGKNLSDDERRMLMQSALFVANQGGMKITMTDEIRRILYNM